MGHTALLQCQKHLKKQICKVLYQGHSFADYDTYSTELALFHSWRLVCYFASLLSLLPYSGLESTLIPGISTPFWLFVASGPPLYVLGIIYLLTGNSIVGLAVSTLQLYIWLLSSNKRCNLVSAMRKEPSTYWYMHLWFKMLVSHATSGGRTGGGARGL